MKKLAWCVFSPAAVLLSFGLGYLVLLQHETRQPEEQLAPAHPHGPMALYDEDLVLAPFDPAKDPALASLTLNQKAGKYSRIVFRYYSGSEILVEIEAHLPSGEMELLKPGDLTQTQRSYWWRLFYRTLLRQQPHITPMA